MSWLLPSSFFYCSFVRKEILPFSYYSSWFSVLGQRAVTLFVMSSLNIQISKYWTIVEMGLFTERINSSHTHTQRCIDSPELRLNWISSVRCLNSPTQNSLDSKDVHFCTGFKRCLWRPNKSITEKSKLKLWIKSPFEVGSPHFGPVAVSIRKRHVAKCNSVQRIIWKVNKIDDISNIRDENQWVDIEKKIVPADFVYVYTKPYHEKPLQCHAQWYNRRLLGSNLIRKCVIAAKSMFVTHSRTSIWATAAETRGACCVQKTNTEVWLICRREKKNVWFEMFCVSA